MKYESVADSTIEWKTPGQTFKGQYLTVKSVESKFGVANFHVFKTSKGVIGCWGSAQLDEKLACIPSKTMVLITFEGIDAIGKRRKNFDVKFASNNKRRTSKRK
jgi:hypothetical protein